MNEQENKTVFAKKKKFMLINGTQANAIGYLLEFCSAILSMFRFVASSLCAFRVFRQLFSASLPRMS